MHACVHACECANAQRCDLAHPCHNFAGTGLICTEAGLTPATAAPGLGAFKVLQYAKLNRFLVASILDTVIAVLFPELQRIQRVPRKGSRGEAGEVSDMLKGSAWWPE